MEKKMTQIFRHEFTVGKDALDEIGHVNNVVYVQWMQDVATLHSDAAGCTAATKSADAVWVVRSHKIEYLRPAFAGDPVAALTWVENFRRVASLRKYTFVRTSDDTILAKGETDWVFVDARSGRPRIIPQDVIGAFWSHGEDQRM
jgi:acyl-CoA thioester hydrolase